jgi:glycosyltransferase
MANWLTVITTCLNEERNIWKHLNHLQDLSENEIEIILIDGGSNDKTLDLIEEFNSKNIKFFKYSNLSIYEAFNVGIHESTSNYLSFLGVGDLLYKDFLMEVQKNLNNYNYDIIYGDLLYYSNKKNFKHTFQSYNSIKKNNIKTFPFSHSGSIQNKNLFIKFGNFNIAYKIAADYEWLCRIVNQSSLFTKKINFIQSKMSLGGYSTNAKHYKTLNDETSKIRNIYNISRSYKTILISFFHFFKHLFNLKK